jgi:SAM-dependent methyltransferase
MLIGAVGELDFFSWMAGRTASVAEIARHFGAHERPIDVMTTLFVAMGLLERQKDSLALTKMATEHLVATSPWFLGPYYPKVSDRPIARDLIAVLRSGQPANFAGRRDEQDWHKAMATEDFAEDFTAAMDRRGLLLSRVLAANLDLRGHSRLLDVAGGSGIYACAIAARFPHVSAAVLEKPPVDNIARRAIAKRGYESRVGVVAGDILAEPLPKGFDVHLFSNVLHDWDEPIVRQLLSASHAALPQGGAIVIHEAFLDRDKAGPLPIAAYSVLLMHVTQGRCYGVGEMEAWLIDTGFDEVTTIGGAIGRSSLVARKR